VPECKSCGLKASFATNPIADTTTAANSNILTCSGSATSNVPGNVLQSGFTCKIGFFSYILAGASSASGLADGKFGCVACAAPTSVTANVIVNNAPAVAATAAGSGDATTTALLHGIFGCTYTAETSITSAFAAASNLATTTCIAGVAPVNGGVDDLIGVQGYFLSAAGTCKSCGIAASFTPALPVTGNGAATLSNILKCSGGASGAAGAVL